MVDFRAVYYRSLFLEKSYPELEFVFRALSFDVVGYIIRYEVCRRNIAVSSNVDRATYLPPAAPTSTYIRSETLKSTPHCYDLLSVIFRVSVSCDGRCVQFSGVIGVGKELQ